MPDTPVQLPGFIIAELFKNALVEIDNEVVLSNKVGDSSGSVVQQQTNDNGKSIKFFGKNEKHVVVVVNSTEAGFINDADLRFLTKLLKACGLDPGDIAIVNTNSQPLTFTGLKEELGAKTILLFGVETGDIKLPFTIPLFQVQHYAGCTIVPSPPLSELDKETVEARVKKRNLWDSLQRSFGLS